MLKLNSELRAQAREALQGNWVMAAVAALIYSAIVSATSYLPLVGTLLVGLPVAYGFTILMFSVIKGAKDIDLGILFEGFKDYSRIMGTVVLVFIYTFLWSLLLIIPGIIKHYSYAMTPYILKEEPEMKNNAAIEKSMVMMDGNKMKLFMLDLSFIGWAILCLFTFGIGFFFLQPYMQASHAAFYEDLKAQQGGNVEVNVEVNVDNQSFSASDVCIFLSSTVLFYFYDKRVAFVTILYHLSLLSAEKKYPFGLLCLFATLAKGILSLHSCNLQSLGFGGCSFHCSTNRLQPFSMCLATR